MPDLGETVAEGIVTRWYKNVGDLVRADEVLFDVETKKVSSEFPAPANGVLEEILVPAGSTARVGERLAVIRENASETGEVGRLSSAPGSGAGAQRLVPTAEHADDIVKPPLAAPAAGAQDKLSSTARGAIEEAPLGTETPRAKGAGRSPDKK